MRVGRFGHGDCRTCASGTVALKYHGGRSQMKRRSVCARKGRVHGRNHPGVLIVFVFFFSRLAETRENRIVTRWCVQCSFAFASHAADFERSINPRRGVVFLPGIVHSSSYDESFNIFILLVSPSGHKRV
ncbi:unnamed protein product [Ixodes pacificus]